MASVSDSSKNLDISRVVLLTLVGIVLMLATFLIYKLAHHSTDNFSIPSHQTKLIQPLKSQN